LDPVTTYLVRALILIRKDGMDQCDSRETRLSFRILEGEIRDQQPFFIRNMVVNPSPFFIRNMVVNPSPEVLTFVLIDMLPIITHRF
jgi:hypothetical protein